MRFARDRGFEGLDKKDPFGERKGWDEHPGFARISGIDLDDLAGNMQSDDLRSKHFGPDWGKTKTVMQHAGQRTKDNPGRGKRDSTAAEQNGGVTAMAAAARWTPEMLSKLPQTYEEMVAADDDVEEELETEVPDSLRADAPGREEVARAVGGRWAEVEDRPPVEEVQGSPAVEPQTAPAQEPAAPTQAEAPPSATPDVASRSPDDAAASSAAAATDAEDGISELDPLQWTPDDVVAWLRKYASIDDDMANAFLMMRVDGRMLLNDVMPCDLFKEMRKWHKRGRKAPPKVPELLVQETIILCYPYGKC